MKLKNKKTGEIIDDGYVRETHDFQFDGQKHVLAVFNGNGYRPPERVSGVYTSLAELNEEWEDYEEPKEYWSYDTIDNDVTFNSISNEDDRKADQEIGNFFETKEEAEKAVEKLKAWKRLKDGGITFKNWTINQTGTIDCFATWGNNIPPSRKDPTLLEDLDLLFGGEE